MTRRTRLFLALALLVPACAGGRFGPSAQTPVTQEPRPIDELTVQERLALLDLAQVWQPVDTDALDLLAGPASDGAFSFSANVPCTFNYPDEPLSGATPKFECELPSGKIVKVKYGVDNGEVYAEVAATRLFWAMGFFVDRMYPVKVTCIGCPADPDRVSTTEWRLGRPGNVHTLLFDPATIERKLHGEEIEVPGYEGWSWHELEPLADNEFGASRAHIDALKLLAVFVQHVDSKPEQQAIICPDDQIRKDVDGNATCAAPLLTIRDLGASFGDAKRLNYDKMVLESWRSVRIWKEPKTCRADLTRSIVGTLEDPYIAEAGRKFLADHLSLLSDQQLHDLFTAARVERRSETIHGRQVSVEDWVRAFKEKRRQIVEHRCPATVR